MLPIKDDQPRYSTPFVNTFLIVLNILIFFYQWTLGPRAGEALVRVYGEVPAHLAAFLAGSPRYTATDALVPFFTSIFLHGSWMHVIFNMWGLYIFGDNIEDYLGHFKYLLLYFAGGLVGGLTHILLNLNSRVPTIGASGAIAAVMGAYFILYPRARVLTWFFVFVLWLPAWLVLGYWFLVQFVGVSAVAESGVAVWAHLGGFVAGVIMIKIFPERPHRYRYGTW